MRSYSTVIMKLLSRELLQNVYLCSSKYDGFRILESVEERSSSVHRQEIKQRLITYSKCRHYMSSVTEPEWISVLLSRYLPCKSAISVLLYRIVTGLNRPFLQMCWCPALMELLADTGRADGPHHAIYCREGSQLAAGEELCRQNLFHQGDYFSEDNAEWSVQKRLHRGIMLFEFYRTVSDKHKCRKRRWFMDSANDHPFAASLYALRSSQLRIQLKARNKSVRQQARLTKSQNTSLSLQSRPFGGCELLQNVYLCSSKHNFMIFYVTLKLLWIASKCVSLQ